MPKDLSIDIDGKTIPLTIKRNTRARRIILRVPGPGLDPVLTLPPHMSLASAEKFLANQHDWLREQLEMRPEKIQILPGAAIPLRGRDHVILHGNARRGLVEEGFTNGLLTLKVYGDELHLERRLKDWLRGQARTDLTLAVERHAKMLDRKATGIRLTDARGRWGSCSSKGTLNFSWRLILAPPFILDYVAAHEVSHLAEMNHGSRFWKLCRQLAPRTDEARQWMRKKGQMLHQYF